VSDSEGETTATSPETECVTDGDSDGNRDEKVDGQIVDNVQEKYDREKSPGT
jgi:hypothetical protein